MRANCNSNRFFFPGVNYVRTIIIYKSKQNWEYAPVPTELKKRFDGVGTRKDKNGFYVRTHRARSKSYCSLEAIPLSIIKFIRSTG